MAGPVVMDAFDPGMRLPLFNRGHDEARI